MNGGAGAAVSSALLDSSRVAAGPAFSILLDFFERARPLPCSAASSASSFFVAASACAECDLLLQNSEGVWRVLVRRPWRLDACPSPPGWHDVRLTTEVMACPASEVFAPTPLCVPVPGDTTAIGARQLLLSLLVIPALALP